MDDDESDEDEDDDSDVRDTNADSEGDDQRAFRYEYYSDGLPEESWTWLSRCVLTDDLKLECLDLLTDSIIIQNTSV